MSEAYPSDIRAISIGLTYSTMMAMGAANALAFPVMLENIKFYGTFYFYSVVMFVGASWAFYILPDNRGLTLVKIEERLEAQNAKMKEMKNEKQMETDTT